MIIAFALCSMCIWSYSQTDKIKIEFIGNCGIHMTDGDENIYVDFPYKSGAYGYMEFDKSDLDRIRKNSIFIFTHTHADHYSKKNLKKVMRKKGGKKYGFFDIASLETLNTEIAEFEIEALKTRHTFFGVSFKHYSYMITWHGKKIYISGDTTDPRTIGEMKNIDLAFIPFWIYNNAKEQGIEVDAKEFAIYHLYPEQIPNAVEEAKKIENLMVMGEKGQTIIIEL